MDCRSCGVVNAPGRRYCRECGGRLGQPCPVCHFFNAAEDKHCGGCGRRLKAAGPLAAEIPPMPAFVPPQPGGLELDDEPLRPAPAAADAGGQGVSQSEIDGLFENILDDGPAGEGGA